MSNFSHTIFVLHGLLYLFTRFFKVKLILTFLESLLFMPDNFTFIWFLSHRPSLNQVMDKISFESVCYFVRVWWKCVCVCSCPPAEFQVRFICPMFTLSRNTDFCYVLRVCYWFQRTWQGKLKKQQRLHPHRGSLCFKKSIAMLSLKQHEVRRLQPL